MTSPAPTQLPSEPPQPDHGASAQIPPAEQIMHDLANDLMSPYCPGRTIASCPSPNARKLETHIREQAEAGKTRQEIEKSLVERFGSDIQGYIGRPEILYGTALVALLAIVALVVAARRWTRSSAARAPSPMTPDELRAPGAAAGPRAASGRENDALDDALDRIDEF